MNIPVRTSVELQTMPPIADKFEVGESTEVLITRMRMPVEKGREPSTKLLVGDILRRTCRLGNPTPGKEACKAVCQAPEGFTNADRECSDLNLGGTLFELGIHPNEVLMVGVTADEIGFYDQLEEYRDKEDKSVVKTNPLGFQELPGFNAFFARDSDRVVLGARLADCGFAVTEFKDAYGEMVRGFVHLTRPNMQGESKLEFEIDGQPAGSFEYFLDTALKHYGGDKNSVNVRVVAAIKSEHFIHDFSGEGIYTPEGRFPGWFDMGLLQNASNPDWQQGDPINPDDQWYPKYREMVRWQTERSGLNPGQISFEDCIDPGDLELGHASNHHGFHGGIPDARDAYLVMKARDVTQPYL